MIDADNANPKGFGEVLKEVIKEYGDNIISKEAYGIKRNSIRKYVIGNFDKSIAEQYGIELKEVEKCPEAADMTIAARFGQLINVNVADIFVIVKGKEKGYKILKSIGSKKGKIVEIIKTPDKSAKSHALMPEAKAKNKLTPKKQKAGGNNKPAKSHMPAPKAKAKNKLMPKKQQVSGNNKSAKSHVPTPKAKAKNKLMPKKQKVSGNNKSAKSHVPTPKAKGKNKLMPKKQKAGGNNKPAKSHMPAPKAKAKNKLMPKKQQVGGNNKPKKPHIPAPKKKAKK